MKEFHGRASANVDAEPRRVLEFTTDVDRLREWNAAIEAVAKKPTELHPGEKWIVEMHPPQVPSWKSVSRVEELNLNKNHFAYETVAGGTEHAGCT
jgi:uncharacterized protein YndB with AHSA1/START domain